MGPQRQMSGRQVGWLSGSLFACFLVTLAARAASPDAGTAALFQQKCTACHTIGKGKLVGPDLAGVSKRSDADLRTSINRMKAFAGPLTDEQITNLIGFLKSQPGIAAAGSGGGASNTAGGNAAPTQPQAESQAINTAAGTAGQLSGAQAPASTNAGGSAQRGRLLFSGQRTFTNGGMSCVSCHQSESNGGTLGPSLADVVSRMSESELASACQTTAFPSMKDLYLKHPVTRQEAVDLTAYLESLKGKSSRENQIPVDWLGSLGAVAILALIAWGCRDRKTSARSKLRRK